MLGPEDLSPNEIASIVGETIGREVRFEQIAPDAFGARLRERGMLQPFVKGYVDMMVAKNEGMDNVAERSRALPERTTFRDWCEQELTPAITA